MGCLIKTDGTVKEVYPKNGIDFKLEELSGFVGGYIECVYIPGGFTLVVNEEGKLKGLPYNEVATRLYDNPHDEIVGDAVLCADGEIL